MVKRVLSACVVFGCCWPKRVSMFSYKETTLAPSFYSHKEVQGYIHVFHIISLVRFEAL